MPDAAEERRLALAAAAGDRAARSRLIEANLGLVATIARRYRGLGVPHEDLLQEGAVGLTIAVDRFRIQSDARFGTYAAWWIRQAIMHALSDQARTIRLPHQVVADQVRVRRADAVIRARAGHAGSLEELAEESGLAVGVVSHALSAVEARESLDRPVARDDDGATLASTIADDTARDPLDVVLEAERAADVRAAVDRLPARERFVVAARYGLDSAPETLDALAHELGVTRERVRQIERHALAQLAPSLPSYGEVRAEVVPLRAFRRAGARRASRARPGGRAERARRGPHAGGARDTSVRGLARV